MAVSGHQIILAQSSLNWIDTLLERFFIYQIGNFEKFQFRSQKLGYPQKSLRSIPA